MSLCWQVSIAQTLGQATLLLAQEGGFFVGPGLLPLLIIFIWFILVAVAAPVAAMAAALGIKTIRRWRRLDAAAFQGKEVSLTLGTLLGWLASFVTFGVGMAMLGYFQRKPSIQTTTLSAMGVVVPLIGIAAAYLVTVLLRRDRK